MPIDGDLEVIEYFYNQKTEGALPEWVFDLSSGEIKELIESIPNNSGENQELIRALDELR